MSAAVTESYAVVDASEADTSEAGGTTTTTTATNSYEECVIRVLDATSKEIHKEAKKRAKARRMRHDQTNASLTVGAISADGGGASTVGSDTAIAEEDEDIDDEGSIVVPFQYLDAGGGSGPVPDYEIGWKAKYRIPIKAVEIKGTHKTGVIINVTLGKLQQTRELIFDNMEEAEDFQNVLKTELANEDQRRENKLQATLGDKKVPPGERLKLLVEIVSAWDIIAGDYLSSDPFVTCMMDGKEVHRTKYIPKT